jgi:plasmid maintenance system antidote protein VapI
MSSEDTTEALRKAAKIGLTAAQAAEMIGITANTARRKAKKAGFSFPNAHRLYNEAVRDDQILAKKKLDAEKARKNYRKRIEDIKKKAAEIECPRERREMIYGAALLAFEKKQADDGKRDKLPCDAPSPEARAKRKRYAGYNWQPLEIDGVRFPSRGSAAEALGVSRGELSAMISDRATPHRRQKLAYLLNEYRKG